MVFRVTIDAFTLTPACDEAVQQAARSPVLARSRLNRQGGGLAAAVACYADAPSPQVIVAEEADDDRTLLARLDQLAEVCEPGTRVIIIGRLNDIRLYRSLLAHGVSDYLVAPVEGRHLADAIAALFADPAAQPRGKLVAVWGVRGGTGASTLAQNLAWHLGQVLGEPALYLDLDLAFGTSEMAFNLEARQGSADALAQPDRLDPVLLDRFLVGHDEHLKLLPSAGDPRRAPPPEADAVERLVDLAAKAAPAVVLDLPHLWSGWTQSLLGAADELVLVARPDLVCLRDAKLLFDLLADRRAARPRLVLNMVDAFRKTQLTAKDFEDTLGAASALSIAFDPLLFGQAANGGQLLGEVGASHKIVGQLASFAAQLAGRAPGGRRGGKSLWSWLKG